MANYILNRDISDTHTGSTTVEKLHNNGRKGYAAGARHRTYMRDVVVMKEPLPSPVKKSRFEPYHEERRHLSKPVFKTPESRLVNPVKVIEKKPVLNTAAVEEWRALPQRNTAPRRKHPQTAVPKKPEVITTKPVVKPAEQKQKEVPVTKEVKEVKEIQAVKDAKVAKEVPAVNEPKEAKEVPVVEEAKLAKEVPAEKEVQVVKEVPAVKEATVGKEVPGVKEVKVVKEATVAKEVPAVKEAKVVTKEVPAVKEVKVLEEVPATKEAPPVKSAPEAKGADNENTKATKAKPKPDSDGMYELDAVMASVLHEELAQIMIKVWQELPDSPPTEAEELVADRFRNAAGDDLQNALGLSVTSRLLNIHNPLYAKLNFSGKPEAGCLESFIRDNNICSFKRVADKYCDTFAARFEDIRSFDRLCAQNKVKCGTVTVTIQPCYKYLSCPPSIRTIYSVNTDKSKKTARESCTNASPQKLHSEKEKENKTAIKNRGTNKTASPTEKASVKAKEATKDSASNKVTPKKAEEKSGDKSKVKSDFDDEMMVVDEMGEEDDDDEEMTDQDILALMSGGIVLDECSGSDDEK